MKYIVKNCPCNITYKNIPEDNTNCCSKKYGYCYSISDCLIKRVIEKCYEELGIKYNDIEQGRNDLANELFNMFEIERVKE